MANFILDTNVLLRFCDPASSSYALARQAVTKLLAAGDQIYVAPQSLAEFWVVATRPSEANGLGWDTQKTRSEIEQLLDQFPLLEDACQPCSLVVSRNRARHQRQEGA
jgi:predicted nucleic acid-binding protein